MSDNLNLTEQKKLLQLCMQCSNMGLNVKCQLPLDFCAFTERVARHHAFPLWLEMKARARLELEEVSVTEFINEHAIDIGLNARAKASRRNTRQQNFRKFARQLVALRRVGVVHGQTRDGRGIGLFLLNSAEWLDQGALLTEICKIAGADSMWSTNSENIAAAAKQVGLCSAVDQDKKKLSLLVGPLSWLNHSLLSGVLFTGGTPLLRMDEPDRGMLFNAGFRDRQEIRIRYVTPPPPAGRENNDEWHSAIATWGPWIANDIEMFDELQGHAAAAAAATALVAIDDDGSKRKRDASRRTSSRRTRARQSKNDDDDDE